ncbi:putative serine/threonine-protein kinase [Sesbania bispinosa]|nr:putative serine/threonine-protein kinase [Sesbania bispinosa]
MVRVKVKVEVHLVQTEPVSVDLPEGVPTTHDINDGYNSEELESGGSSGGSDTEELGRQFTGGERINWSSFATDYGLLDFAAEDDYATILRGLRTPSK